MAALPTLTATYTGFVNGDTSSSLTTQPTLTSSATASSHVSGSPYSITASGAVDTDYSISYVAGTLTVTPVALIITANDQSKVYGAALPTLTASYSGLVNGDTSASLTTQPTLTTTATASSHVAGNPYTITASGAVDSDYTISYVAGTLTVTAAPLTITASNQSKTYGAVVPALTASYTGFVNGDTSASLTVQPTLTTTATAHSHVSGNPYSIIASGAADSDYAISYVNGNMTVTPAPLTITAVNQTKAYGASLPTLTASYTGFVNGDTSASLTTQPTLEHDRHGQQPCGGQPLCHHRQRRGRCRLQHQLRRRHPHRHPGGVDDHRRQQEQGLRCGVADTHGQLLRLRQWRYIRQPDDSAYADHNGHGQQPRLGQPLHHHRQRCGGYRLYHYLRGRHSHRHQGSADHHRRQSDQGLRCGVADSDGQLLQVSSMAIRLRASRPSRRSPRPPRPAAMSRATRTPSPPAARSTATTRSATSPAP